MTLTVDLHGSKRRFRFVTMILPLTSLLVDYHLELIFRTTKALYQAPTLHYARPRMSGPGTLDRSLYVTKRYSC